MLGFAIYTFRHSHMDLFSHLGCLVCGILSFVFLIYSNTFLIFWHSHKCTFSYLYFSQLGCPSFRNYQFQFYQFCHSQQEVPSFVFPSFMSLPCGLWVGWSQDIHTHSNGGDRVNIEARGAISVSHPLFAKGSQYITHKSLFLGQI